MSLLSSPLNRPQPVPLRDSSIQLTTIRRKYRTLGYLNKSFILIICPDNLYIQNRVISHWFSQLYIHFLFKNRNHQVKYFFLFNYKKRKFLQIQFNVNFLCQRRENLRQWKTVTSLISICNNTFWK